MSFNHQKTYYTKGLLFLLLALTHNCTICKAQDKDEERKVGIEAFVVDSFSLAPVGQILFTIRDTEQRFS